ncbi:MAG: tape measure protein [Burkholderiales bacterium]|nr:tape measure protein [Burkholderiales bacterium]
MSNFEVGVRLTADGKDLVGASHAAQSEISRISQAAKKANAESAAAAERFTASLKRQADTIGLTASQALKYDTAQLKLNATQRASVDASIRTIEAYERQQVAARKNIDVLGSLKTQVIAAGTAYISFRAAIDGGRAVVQAALAQERLNNTLKVGLGDQQAATREIAFLREEADKLGLEFAGTAQQYAKLTVASKGTELQGQKTRDIFLSVAKASTVLGLSADQTQGALTAIEQIISKNTVSTEELRGQLGERLTGAFQVAARAIGLTTQQLDEQLSRGELMAEQFLPALAAELEKTYGAQAQESAQGLNAQINRLDNSFTDLKLTVADAGIIDMFSDSVVAATEFIGITARVIEQLRKIANEAAKIPGVGQVASNITPSNIIKTITGNNILGNIASSGILEQLLGKNARAEVVATTQELQKAEEVIFRIVRPGAKPQAPAEFSASMKREAEERKKLADQVIRDAQRAAKAREDEEKRAVDGAKRIIDALKRENEEVGKNTVQKRLMAAAAEAAKAPTKELAQDIMASAQAWAQATLSEERITEEHRKLKELAQTRAREEIEAAREVEQQWSRMWSTVENTARTSFIQFAAHGTDAMKSIGRAIQNSIIDLLYQLTLRPFIINVGTRLFNGASGAGGANTASGALSTGLSAASFFNAGAGAFSGSGLLGSFGAGFSGGSSAAAFIASESAVTGAGLAAYAGAAAAPLAIAFAGTQILKSIAGDKRLGGGFGKTLNAIGDVPILGDLIPVVPLVNAIFGRGAPKFNRDDLVGTITASGFDGVFNRGFKEKGGLARSSRFSNFIVDADTGGLLNEFGRLSESGNIPGALRDAATESTIQRALEIGKALDDSVSATTKSLRSVAETLDISTASLDKFSFSVDLTTEKGKQLEDSQIAQVIAEAAEQMATGLLPQVSDLSKRGESALQTLVRLSSEFESLENTVRLLGHTSTEAQTLLRSFTLEQRSAAVELAGGTDALNSKTQFFFNNVLTDTQKFAIVSADLRKELAKYGVTTVPTIEKLNNAVTSGKLTWEQFVTALDLTPMIVQANQYRDAINTATQSIVSPIDALETAFSALQQSVAAERDRLTNDYNKSLDAVNQQISDVTDSVGKLRTLSAAINQTVVALRPISRDQAKQQIRDAIAAAQTGNFPTADSLRESLTTLARRDTSGFASSFEFEREQRKTANLVGELGDLTNTRLSTEERSLQALEEQRKALQDGFDRSTQRLDSMLGQGREAIDRLRGIETGVLSLADALKNINAASAAAGGPSNIGSPGLLPFSNAGGSIRSDRPITVTTQAELQPIRDFFAKNPTPKQIFDAAKKNNISSGVIASALGLGQKQIDQFFEKTGLPRFAGGGLHSGGLRIVGERGPEIEATGPARITSNNDLRNMLSNENVVAAINQLIAELQSNSTYNKRVANKLDSVTITVNGVPALRTGT